MRTACLGWIDWASACHYLRQSDRKHALDNICECKDGYDEKNNDVIATWGSHVISYWKFVNGKVWSTQSRSLTNLILKNFCVFCFVGVSVSTEFQVFLYKK